MNIPSLTPKSAWLPLTPRGVAAFALARAGRLWLAQFLFALLVAGVLGWFLHKVWAPTIRAAIVQLPPGTTLTNGVLEWPGPPATLLAENSFLSLSVDLDHAGRITSDADVRVEFGRNDWQIASLLGVLDLPEVLNTAYPVTGGIALSRAEVDPWWGAREPFLIAIVMAVLVICLLTSWTLLATVYFLPVWLVGFYANRALTWGGSWRLAGAALMPGALWVAVSLVLYGLGVFDLVKFLLAFVLHLLLGWIYLGVSPLFLPRNPEVLPPGKNPFQPAP